MTKIKNNEKVSKNKPCIKEEEDETDDMTPEIKKKGEPEVFRLDKLNKLEEDEESEMEESTDRDPLMGNRTANNNKLSVVAVNSKGE